MAPSAAAQTDPTVKDFKRYFKKAKETVERVEFVRSLEKIDDPGVAEVLIKVLQDKEPAVAAAAAEVIGQLPSATAREPLLPIVEKGKPAQQLAPILRCAAKGKWEEFLPLLNPLVQVAAIESLVQMGQEQVEACLPPLLKALDDEETSVQVAGCLALRTLRHRDAIPPLINTWQEGSGLVLQHIYPTLLEITDLQFGADAAQWARWWDRAQENYEIPSDEKLAERREARAKTAALYVPKEGSAAFAGIATPSQEVVFVIDISGSMEDAVLDREKFRQAGHTRFSKMDILKKELTAAIEGLGDNVVFNVHAFASEVDSWRKDLVPANALNKKSAVSFVQKLKPIGGAAAQQRASAGLSGSANVSAGRTNTYAALMAGLGVKDEKVALAVTRDDSIEVDGNGDTMFFFSDGLPTVGALVDTDEILEAVGKFNEFRRISIHAVAIGDFKKTWMRRLADENSGQFVDLGR
jgi:hypothetical protein